MPKPPPFFDEKSGRKLFILIPLLFALGACQKKYPPAPLIPPHKVTLSPGDTLGESLREIDLTPAARNEIIGGLARVFNPRRCRVGDYYEVLLDSAPRQWSTFRYYPPGIDYYLVTKSTDSSVTSKKCSRAATKVTAAVTGSIHTSLWESLRAKKIEPEIILNFADVFAWQIDFLTEPRKNDTYKIIWEQYVSDDGFVISRQILAAQYLASGENYTALLFTNANGQSDYYSPDGKALRSAFLRAPLQFRRISSYFTLRRFHPILKYFRPHLGIDYAAPTGTPVSSIGEGSVIFAGPRGGFGNFIEVRHPNGYHSYYGHLSRYGKGVRSGARIRQGQLIGYVGMTGLASGPHLDFRISREGQFLNFLKLKFPSAGSIGVNDKERFKEVKKYFFTRIAAIR
jgi:murein DD-endopeptidase MepM/ murein hydrolase activator NlpD